MDERANYLLELNVTRNLEAQQRAIPGVTSGTMQGPGALRVGFQVTPQPILSKVSWIGNFKAAQIDKQTTSASN